MASGLVINNLRGAVIGPLGLAVERGTCAALTGPSGAGKSLFLRMIADLDPSEGEVLLDDVPRDAMPAPVWRAQTIYVAAEAGWWGERVDAHFPPDTLGAAKDSAGRLGLPEDCFERRVRTLSTGERQRLALVRALARHPKCLLLDEPTSALDALAIERTEALLREELLRGTILVLVSHDAEQARRLGTRHYVLEAGRLAPA